MEINKTSAQSAIEFVILVGVILFFFAVFFLAIQKSTADKIKEMQNNLLKETAYIIQDEINLALKASNGYSRQFKLPNKIGNQDYSVLIIEDMIYVKTLDNKMAIALPISKVTGSIAPGNNIIKKENGEIKINQ